MRTLALFPLLAASQLPATSGVPDLPPTGDVTRTATLAGVIGALIVLGREYITWRRQVENGPPRDSWRDRTDAPPLRLQLAGEEAEEQQSIREPSTRDDHRSD
jgi:hypothetical protein